MGIITLGMSKYYRSSESSSPNKVRNLNIAKKLDGLLAITLLVVGILGACGLVPGLDTLWAKRMIAFGAALLLGNIFLQYPERFTQCIEKLRACLQKLPLLGNLYKDTPPAPAEKPTTLN